MEIMAVDQQDICRAVCQCFSGPSAPKARPKHHNIWAVIHLVFEIFCFNMIYSSTE